jgi:DNA-binding CsgD family transcriptional regulator
MPRDIDMAEVNRLKAEGLSERKIAELLGIPRTTLQGHRKRAQVDRVDWVHP